jgi:hypothetical protein
MVNPALVIAVIKADINPKAKQKNHPGFTGGADRGARTAPDQPTTGQQRYGLGHAGALTV